MYLPTGSSVWDDIVLALVRADELAGCRPKTGFTERSLRLVRADEEAAEAGRQLAASGHRHGQPLLHP